nr:hypothetical protein [Tanacetum cinerariifolium]
MEVKDYNYYKTKMLLAKKDSDEQVLLAEDQAWMESSSDFDMEINANMVFMAQIQKVLPHCFNVESDFVESLSNRDTLIDSSLKFDFLEEFSGTLLPTSVADEERIKREHAEYISLMERLFTINPCPRPMENSNTIVGTLLSNYIREKPPRVVPPIEAAP